jgi:hypothetical protein
MLNSITSQFMPILSSLFYDDFFFLIFVFVAVNDDNDDDDDIIITYSDIPCLFVCLVFINVRIYCLLLTMHTDLHTYLYIHPLAPPMKSLQEGGFRTLALSKIAICYLPR